jgi:hypothetical protein
MTVELEAAPPCLHFERSVTTEPAGACAIVTQRIFNAIGRMCYRDTTDIQCHWGAARIPTNTLLG